MFYLGWIALTASGILVGVSVFLWALKSGQFSDQGRARYLPLSDELPVPPVENASRPPTEVYALVIIIAVGLIAMMTTVILTIMSLRG